MMILTAKVHEVGFPDRTHTSKTEIRVAGANLQKEINAGFQKICDQLRKELNSSAIFTVVELYLDEGRVNLREDPNMSRRWEKAKRDAGGNRRLLDEDYELEAIIRRYYYT